MKLSIVKKAGMAAVEELLNFRERQQLENTIYRVYVPFSRQHEQWVNNLFDLSFLVGNGFDVLAKAANNADSVSSYDLAQAWADQFGFENEPRTGFIEEATGVADEFLKLFLREFDDKAFTQAQENNAKSGHVARLDKHYGTAMSKQTVIYN